MAGSAIPARPGAPEVVLPEGTTAEQASLLVIANTDWNWVFHWEPVIAPDPAAPPHDLAALVAADIAAGLPVRQAAAPWASLAYPGYGPSMVLPGAVADVAAGIDVPVLLATGERDLCRPLPEEIATFKAATDLSVLVVPQMAHMHNFAVTRTVLWERLDEFVAHVGTVITADR
jgi:pimeloyl-ACP methyl ester carboxylesterase